MSESELHCRPMAGDEPMLSLLELSERFDEVVRPERGRFGIRRGGTACAEWHVVQICAVKPAGTMRTFPSLIARRRSVKIRHVGTIMARRKRADISVPPKGSLCGRLVGVSITERGFSRTLVPSRRVSREGTYADHVHRFSRSHYARSRMLFRRSRPLRYGQRSGAIERRFR